MPSLTNNLYAFGEFRLEVQSRQLRRGGELVALTPKAFDVLLFLLQRSGEVVSKETLMNGVWPDSFVEESNLTQTVFMLRKALGETGEQRYILTVPGRGYRFIALVTSDPKTGATEQPPQPANQDLIGTKVSHYRVLQLLGGGGMGVVYQAEDLKLGRRVAIKFLPGELAGDATAFERLRREARAASALDHPNICMIHELGEHEGQPFIVMQLLAGQTLREWIEENGNPGSRLDAVIGLASQIADGLNAAHKKGIVHRDIKPANVFITTTGQAKILDFGVAKFLAETVSEHHEDGAKGSDADPHLTRTGVSVGTPSYLSPEQVRGEELDPRTDLFSLGLVLYEMTTGARAFAGTTAAEIRDAVLSDTPVPARQVNPEIPPALEKIIVRALEKDRDRRYQTAEELKLELDRLRREGQSAESAPRSPRVRRIALGALVIFVAATAFLIPKSWQSQRLPFESVRTTRLTSAGQSFKAAISPDGRYIAHTLLESGRESLRVRRTKMLDDIELVPPRPVRYIGISFSPDSEMIYYVIRDATEGSGILYRVPVIGGSPQKVKDNITSPITTSPDGGRFAFVRETAQESALLVAEFESDGVQTLIAHKLPIVMDYPAWSPDGRSIAYTMIDSAIASTTGSNARIMEVRVADGTEKALSSQSWAFVRQLAWLKDERGLVMTARDRQEPGLYHVWYVSYPDGIARKVTAGLTSQVGASISADSRNLVTVEEKSFSSIWRVTSTHSQDLRLVVSGSSGSSAPVWTPDGRVVFEEELDGRRSLWSTDADGKDRKELTLTANNYDQSVSGDGRKLAWVSDRSGSPAIWTMDIGRGNPAMVTPATGEPVPQLSPDGNWIAFTAIGTKHWTTLWSVASGGGQGVELNDKLWSWPVISSEGKWIAGFYADRELGTQKVPDSIAIIGANGGPVRKVIPLSASVALPAGIRWRPNNHELTYVDHGNDGDNIWSQSIDGGKPHQLTYFHGLTLFSFDWSRDGKQLAFSRGVLTRDVVLLEDASVR